MRSYFYLASCFILITSWPAMHFYSAEEVTIAQEDKSSLAEAELLQKVLSFYKKHGTIPRPVTNGSLPISIKFGLRVINVAVFEKEQTIRLSAWCRIMWHDVNFKWNPDDYEGINYISVPRQQIWTPDIDLANTADTEVKERTSFVQSKYTGRMFWTPHRVFKSACLIDITKYPYDQHTCDLWLQSLGIQRTRLDIQAYTYSAAFDLDTFIESYKRSQEWDIITNETKRIETPNDEGAILMYSRRPALRFRLTLRRRVGFRAYLLMIPCLVLSIMTCIVFCLPPERPDRHMLAMSLFASFVVLLLILVETAPPSAASVPNLGYFYGCSMALIILSVFCSAFVLFISRHVERGKPVPLIVRKVFVHFLATVLCLNWHRKGIKKIKKRESLRSARKPERGNIVVDIAPPMDDVENDTYRAQFKQDGNKSPQQKNETQNNLLLTISRRLLSLETLVKSKDSPAKEQLPPESLEVLMSTKMQWKTLTMVLDRLFLVIFLTLNVVSIVSFYPRPQY